MCKIFDGKNEVSSNCKLIVKRKESNDLRVNNIEIPKFDLQLRDTTVNVGDIIVLNVTNNTMPEPDDVKWYKENNKISHDDQKYFISNVKGKYTLEIKKAQISDSGCYKAIGINKNGKCTSTCQVTVTDTNLLTPPQFTNSLKNEKVEENNSIKFEVDLNGSPPLTVKWLKDNNSIIQNDRIKIVDGEKFNKFSLEILQTLKSDAGNYKCIASNEVGEAETNCILEIQEIKSVKQQLTNPSPPTFISPLSDIREFPEMVEMSIICIVTGEPQPSIRWYKDNEPISKHNETTFNNGVASLIIRMPKISDSGVYTCEATNDIGVAKCSGIINIKEVNQITQISPKFVEELANVSVMEGDEIILKCQLIGKPTPYITWYKDGLKLLMNNRILQYIDRHGNVKLNIIGAQLDDSGEYTCEAQNLDKKNNLKDFTHCNVCVNGSDLILDSSTTPLNINNKILKDSKVIEIKKNQPPVIVKEPPSLVKIHEGNKELIEIEIDKNNDTNIEWLFEGKPLVQSNTMKTYFDGRIAFLKFFQANKLQQGVYKFIASNKFGAASSEIEIIVESVECDNDYISKMPLFTKKLENIMAKFHDKIILECEINGTPDVIVKWLLNGKILNSSQNIIFHNYSKDNLSINKVEFTDITKDEIGTLTCLAINKYGECNNSCEIIPIKDQSNKDINDNGKIVMEKPLIIENLQNQTVNEGDTAVLNCKIDNILHSNICYFKNGIEIFSSTKYQYEFNENGNISLKIKNCNKNDEGLYTCSISNNFGNEITTCNLFIEKKLDDSRDPLLTSTENENFGIRSEKEFPPKFTRTPLPTINIGEGKKLDVIIKAIGNPIPHIVWMKDGKILKRSNKIYQTWLTGNGEAVLSINCPVLKSSGVFTCIAENVHGKEAFDFNIIVMRSAYDLSSNMNEIPKFTKELDDIGVMVCDSIELECELTGFPEPSVEWIYIDDNGMVEKINTNQAIWEESRVKNNLKLFNKCITKKQQGTYQCIATNKNGTALTQCYLLVGIKIDEVAKPPKIIKKLCDQFSLIGGSVEFDIEYEGYPTINVLWYKNGKRIKENINCFSQTTDNNKSKLTINNITVDDFGCYSVSLTNIHGQLEHVCYLKFGEKPEKINENGKNFSQDDEYLSKSTVKIRPTEKCNKNNRKKSRNLVHLKKGTPPTFIVGLSDMNLKAGDCATVSVYDESKEEINTICNEKNSIIYKDEENAEELSNLQNSNKIQDNLPALEDIRRSILTRNKRICRPKFFVKPKPKKILDEFKSLRLKCGISANPIATVSWDKNGIILESGNKYSIYNDGNFYFLEVHNLSICDSGFYNCSVFNTEGFVSCSSEIEIKPANEDKKLNFIKKRGKNFCKPNFEEKFSEEITIDYGHEFSLECIVSGYPVPEVIWYKDGHEIIPHKNQFKILYDGEHTSLNFLSIDSSKNGKYICKATNSEGSTYCSTTINVIESNNVILKDKLNIIKPKFKYSSSIVKCIDGNEAKLIAKLEEGSNPLGYQWVHNKVLIQDSSAFKYSRDNNNLILTIRDPFPEDAGIYTCQAQNSAGYDRTDIELKIVEQLSKICDMEEKPSIKPLTKKYLFKEDSIGEIIFNVSGNPEPVISWLNKNKQQILASSKYEMICKGNDFILRIHNITADDSGIYYLIAVNAVGTAVEKAMINVASKEATTDNEIIPVFVRKLNDSYNFDIGEENIKLTVQYNGIPEPDVHWYFNNERIRTVDLSYKIITYKMKSTLTILKFDKDCVGEYLCTIRNRCGEDLSRSIVKIKG
uniref:Titin n=1 Tax=Strongyloides papillosus TaxID=174720 RepID=A0A0N5B5S5_STREA